MNILSVSRRSFAKRVDKCLFGDQELDSLMLLLAVRDRSFVLRKRGRYGCPVPGWANGGAYSMKSSSRITCTPSARRPLSGSSTQH